MKTVIKGFSKKKETNLFNHSKWNKYLVDPKGVALFPLPSDTPVAHTNIPESLSLQLPVVSPGGEGLDGEDLRPVVETFEVSGAGQAALNPRHCAQVIGDAQQRMSRVGVQGQRTGHCKGGTFNRFKCAPSGDRLWCLAAYTTTLLMTCEFFF